MKMKKIAILLLILIGTSSAKAQENPKKTLKESNSYIYEAQEALAENDFVNAEAEYRKAVAKDPSNTAAKYNMGNLYYGKEKSETAETRLKEAAEVAGSKDEKHRIFHNLGNSYMQQKKYQEAVDAFKNALRNNPTDEETRYNLALAKKMLEEEQQNQDDQQDDNKDGGEDENENKDKQEQEKDQNKDGEGGEDENKDQQPKDEGENEKDKQEGENQEDKEQQEGDEKKDEQGKGDEPKQQQPQPAQGQLSPQQIKSLLEAMNNEEKKVQDKINAEKAKGVKVKSEKDW